MLHVSYFVTTPVVRKLMVGSTMNEWMHVARLRELACAAGKRHERTRQTSQCCLALFPPAPASPKPPRLNQDT